MFLLMELPVMATPFFISFQDMGGWVKITTNKITPQPPLLHTHEPIHIGGGSVFVKSRWQNGNFQRYFMCFL